MITTEMAVKAAGYGVWKLDTTKNIISWDETCRNLFGFPSASEISLQEFLTYIYEEDLSTVARTILPTTPDRRFNITFRIKSEGQNMHRWIRMTGDSLPDESGALMAMTGLAQDLTADQQQVKALERNEQKFRQIIQRSPTAMAVYLSRELVIDIANDAMIKVWGKSNEVIGMKLADALPELSNQSFLSLLQQVYDTGIAYSSDEEKATLFVDNKLQTYWFSFTYEPLFNEEGAVYAILNLAVDVTERVTARRALEESRTKLLTSFEQAPVAIALLSSKQFVYEIANQFYYNLVGRTPDQVIGKPLAEVLPELEGQGFDLLLNEVLETGKPYLAPEVPVDLIRNNRLEKIYVDLTFQPQHASNGDVSGILIVANHVSQQVTARKRIERSEAKLSSVIASAPAAMALFLGPDMIIDVPNQAFIDMIGKGPDIADKPLRTVLPELEGEACFQILDDVFSTGKMFRNYGAPADLHRNGSISRGYYNFSFTPLLDEKGVVYAILVLAIDVTEEIIVKQKLIETEEHLLGAIELAQMATWNLNIKKKTVKLSQRFLDWLGLSKETCEIDQIYEQLPDAFRLSIEKAIQEATTQGSTGLYYNEHPIVNKQTGDKRIIQTQGKVFFDLDGSPALLTGTALDVTEQKNLQDYLERQIQERTEELETSNEELAATNEELAATNEELASTNEDIALVNNLLIRSNQNLEQFAYIASHDLQEPLRKIRQFGDLLRPQYDNPTGKALLYLDRMQSAAMRMSVLIEDLLTFARISSQKEQNEMVSLTEIVQNVLTDLELSIHETKAVILQVPLPTILGDKGQLGQLFMNLLSNALKFRRPDVTPQIEIRYQRVPQSNLPDRVKPAQWSAHYHLVEVVDNGIGFEEKYTERIFQVFQRLHGKSEFSGTGIGLSICEKVVANHGGAITAYSLTGQGSTFQVYFPCEITKAPKI